MRDLRGHLVGDERVLDGSQALMGQRAPQPAHEQLLVHTQAALGWSSRWSRFVRRRGRAAHGHTKVSRGGGGGRAFGPLVIDGEGANEGCAGLELAQRWHEPPSSEEPRRRRAERRDAALPPADATLRHDACRRWRAESACERSALSGSRERARGRRSGEEGPRQARGQRGGCHCGLRHVHGELTEPHGLTGAVESRVQVAAE